MNSKPDVQKNLDFLQREFNALARYENHLVVLPECFAFFGGRDISQASIKENYLDGPIQSFLAEQARLHNIWIVAGSMPVAIEQNERFHAACLVFAPDGSCKTQYNKIHLFDVEVSDSTGTYKESATTMAGNQVVVIDTPFAKLGLAICYDLRFPELFRQMQALDADIICVPSAFTQVTGEAHWQVLLQARAIENQCFIVAANQSGTHENGRETWGHSMVVDPWGNIISQQNVQIGTLSCEINLDKITQIRHKMPNLLHRKLK
ncbi:amidohydrolase [Catenovulum maritimum]|uniref:Amidohydrolase n=2 Tax=Catenovulum maritimum TaxID=1513271 RepID=A0A0J8GRR2_9ALTE|nr:amidohydrolase [Catenovulum maritimum]